MSMRPPVRPTRTYSENEPRPWVDPFAFQALVQDPVQGPVTLPGAARIVIVATNDEPGETAVTIADHRVRSRTMNPGQRAIVGTAKKGDVVTPHPGFDVQVEILGEWKTIARG